PVPSARSPRQFTHPQIGSRTLEMPYQFGEVFEKLGIPAMGHQGATWCEIDPQGVMVLMAHQNYFHKRRCSRQYAMPDEGTHHAVGSSATRSLQMIATYFSPTKRILLPVGEFTTDGGPRADGTWKPSKSKHSTGAVYEGRMVRFDLSTGY